MPPTQQLLWYVMRFIDGLLPYVVAAVGVTILSVTPLGRAAMSWLKGHINRGRAMELSQDLERLRSELGEVQERLDFAERSLAMGNAQQRDRLGRAQSATPIPTPT